MNNKEHWENIYSTKKSDEVSWFQPYPTTSMEFVDLFKLPVDSAIIDIGGGDSCLADALLEKNYSKITVLDISANAIDRAKKRLGEKADKVNWIVSDILEFIPKEKYDFWHDRAAFHFLTSEEKINQYVRIATNSINKNGILVLGTFAEDGPVKCSGLDIKQYNENSIASKFETDFRRIFCKTEVHETPFHTMQHFLFCSFQKK